MNITDIALCAGAGYQLLNSFFSISFYRITDEKTLPPENRKRLEDTIQKLAKEAGIKKTIILKESSDCDDTGGCAAAYGNSLLPGPAGITVSPSLFPLLNEFQQEFILAHEIAHIKANDHLTLSLLTPLVFKISIFAVVALLGSTAAISGGFSLFSLLPPVLIYNLPRAHKIAVIATFLFRTCLLRWRERKADEFGYKISNWGGKLLSGSVFNLLRRIEVKSRITNLFNFMVEFGNSADAIKEGKFLTVNKIQHSVLSRFLTTEQGENRMDISHPSSQKRTKYLNEMFLRDFTSLIKESKQDPSSILVMKLYLRQQQEFQSAWFETEKQHSVNEDKDGAAVKTWIDTGNWEQYQTQSESHTEKKAALEMKQVDLMKLKGQKSRDMWILLGNCVERAYKPSESANPK